MNKQTNALLEQIADLSQQIRNNANVQTDTITGVFVEFRRTLERFQAAEEALRQQNEALAQAREQMEVERRRYQEMFEFAPDPYLVTGAQGQIQEANQAAAELLGASTRQLMGRSLGDFVSAESRRLFDTLLEKVQRIQDIELRFQTGWGSALDVSVTLGTVYDEDDQPLLLRWILRDITERSRAQAALNASERRFRTIFHRADLGIFLLDERDQIVETNLAFQQMLGYSDDEMRGWPIARLTDTNDQYVPPYHTQNLLNGDSQQAHYEKRFCAKDKSTVWARVSLTLLKGEAGLRDYRMGLVQNITGERQKEIELTEMRRRLLDSGEAERLRLAQELHDGPLQDLYGAVFKLNGMGMDMGRKPDPDLTVQTVQEAQMILKQVASKLRAVCGELRPPTLANLGLERAIRSHAEQLQEDNPDLSIQLNLARDGQELNEQVRIALYRVYQQCMMNILRHSGARQAMIAFHFDEDEIVLDIWDNGKGFEVPQKWVELLREGHYGLAGIAERVQAMGGRLQIESQPEKGSLVHVVVPRAAIQGES